MEKNIIQLSETYITQLFEQQLPPELLYHDIAHTASVRKTALILADHYQLNETDREAMELASLFHDSGYIKAYTGHEAVSQDVAEAFLSQYNYPPERIAHIKELIAATKLDYVPKNLHQEIIKDSDLNNLGQGKYLRTISNLRDEIAVFLNAKFKDREWYEQNIQFMDNHHYFTDKAKELFDSKKKANRKKVIKVIQNLKAKEKEAKKQKNKKQKDKKQDTKKKIANTINGNRSAQMMFKTALRNHIDLTSIADNKANIMLSINALIITISMPLLASNIEGNEHLIFPTGVLLCTCVASIIYATLATRPIKSEGITTIDRIQNHPTNLFFYGNFFKMPFSDYKSGVKMVLQDDAKLDDTIMSDLYYLGKALGKKFHLLRKCYNVFAIGITLTVLAFVISFYLSNS